MLIPDARAGLLGGLVDDATLLDSPAPDVKGVVEAYRSLRSGPLGWMIGRLVVPASMLEDLAGVLVRTMKSGDSPISLVAVFDRHIAADASTASAFHATMDPAARIDIVRLAPCDDWDTGAVNGGANATHGIHHDVLPLLPLPPTGDATAILSAIGAARGSALRSLGLSLDVVPGLLDIPNLASAIRACSRTSTPFTVRAPWFPATTTVDPLTGHTTVGAMNLLAAVLQTEASVAEIGEALSDDEPSAYAISFTGLSVRGTVLRPKRSIGTVRSPLISLCSHDPAATIDALGALGASA